MGVYNQYTIEEGIRIIEKLGFILLNNKFNDKYLDIRQKLELKDQEGYLYYVNFITMRDHKKHNKFTNNKYCLYNIQLWLDKNNLGMKLLSQNYKSKDDKLILRDNLGYYYTPTLSNYMRKFNAKKFDQSNPYTIQNIKLWCKVNNKSFELVSNTYIKASKKLKWKCLKDDCREIFESSWNEISNGNGCGCCHGLQVGLSNCLATKNPELASEWHPTKNGDLTPYDVTEHSGIKVWWQCKDDPEHEWKSLIYNRSKPNGCGCTECNKSKGERKIKYVLSFYNFIYSSEYTFNDLMGIGGGQLRYDVSIFRDVKQSELRMLIEYDGEYHFKPIKLYKNEPIKYAKERLKKQQYHDQLKNEYCIRNNITLVRIPYWDSDKIEIILEDILIKNNMDSKYIVNNQQI